MKAGLVSLFNRLLYGKFGMMCDTLVVSEVLKGLVSMDGKDLLRDPEVEFTINVDGRYLVTFDGGAKYSKDYHRIIINPMLDDLDRTVLDTHTCGEAYILHDDWKRVYKQREKLND